MHVRAECSLFYRALLQKRPMILRSLLVVATPYMNENKGMRQHACPTGWRRLIGSLILYRSFSAKEPYSFFCKGALQKRLHSAKETYDFKEPTNCSRPIYK